MVGKQFIGSTDFMYYVNIVVEAPDGTIKKFEECLGDMEDVRDGKSYPITPALVREHIEKSF